MKNKLAIATLILTLTSGFAFTEDVWSPGKINNKPAPEITWIQKIVNFFNVWNLF